MKKIATNLLFILLLGFLGFLYGFTKERNEAKKVKNSVVQFAEGANNFLTHKAVNKLLIQNQKNVQNQPKSVVDLHSLETVVSNNPYVEKAAVFLTIDGVLKTFIKQRTAIARLVHKDSSFYVDKFEASMPLSANYSARVPLVSGVKCAEEINELIRLIEVIAKDDFFVKEIIAIEKTPQKEYVFTVRTGNYKILFGTFTGATQKLRKLKAFYNKALKDGTINRYKEINLKYHDQVVCSKYNQDGEQ
ncbi:cell division protein FtsQ/DivIB [Tenacibaculum sp. SG-28]|uniref:cell division protein FtsQ/DivIB n=1 Tax=Tenacibaculum sp. SG-28 TaxID=754426 RepID=UPI000CF3CAD3|nr:cell division protein FtsQ [Tenacibaculum sp. SG-28]PQJ21117.1 cell division protein FtsQ [Tenacibaculum sp. SG-28]